MHTGGVFEIGHFHNFETSLTLMLTLDPVILHTFSSCITNEDEIALKSERIFVGGQMDGH